MRVFVNQATLELVQGDITSERTDAIVNTANSALSGGGGVDGAIHRVGGTAIRQEIQRKYPDGCPRGEARMTGAGDLPCRYVIHAVGPIWNDFSASQADALLASAYTASLRLALDYDLHSIAFPSISTGIYAFPVERAAAIALNTVVMFMEAHPQLQLVRFVLFDVVTFAAYSDALKVLLSKYNSISLPLYYEKGTP